VAASNLEMFVGVAKKPHLIAAAYHQAIPPNLMARAGEVIE
jgi:hypothetical protein